MASTVTALNHYNKTMIQLKFMQKNIEKNLEKDLELELHVPVGLSEKYLSSGLDPADQQMFFEMNGTRLLHSSFPDSARIMLRISRQTIHQESSVLLLQRKMVQRTNLHFQTQHPTCRMMYRLNH